MGLMTRAYRQSALTSDLKPVCQLGGVTTVRTDRVVFTQWLSAWTTDDNHPQWLDTMETPQEFDASLEDIGRKNSVDICND